MRLTSSLLRLRCPGNCSAGGFPDICWGFVVRGSCFLCNFLCNSLELGPCSYLYSLEPECYSSNEERLTSCIVGRFVVVVFFRWEGRLFVEARFVEEGEYGFSFWFRLLAELLVFKVRLLWL